MHNHTYQLLCKWHKLNKCVSINYPATSRKEVRVKVNKMKICMKLASKLNLLIITLPKLSPPQQLRKCISEQISLGRNVIGPADININENNNQTGPFPSF